MNETIEQQQVRIGRYMTAVARTLRGEGCSLDDFKVKVELVVGGSLVNAITLLHWGERSRLSGRPIILFSPTDDAAVPNVTLVAHAAGRTHMIENCMLWMGRRDDRVRLVPDSFQLGAFVFDDHLNLRFSQRSPARSFEAAIPGMGRAYSRLLAAEIAIEETGEQTTPAALLRKAA